MREIAISHTFAFLAKERSLLPENQDYEVLHPKFGEQKGRGGHNKIEYALTIDAAKAIFRLIVTIHGNVRKSDFTYRYPKIGYRYQNYEPNRNKEKQNIKREKDGVTSIHLTVWCIIYFILILYYSFFILYYMAFFAFVKNRSLFSVSNMLCSDNLPNTMVNTHPL